MSTDVNRAVAGAGKTHWLIEHYVNLVVHSPQPLEPGNVAVITFTESASRELVDRVRATLEGLATHPDGQRARDVLASLGAAPIGTIHSFARRILLQHAVPAGVPFGVEVRDGVDPVLHRRMAHRVRQRIVELESKTTVPDADRRRPASFGTTKYLDGDAADLLKDVSGALLRAPGWVDRDCASVEPMLVDAWQALAQASSPPEAILNSEQAQSHLDLAEALLATAVRTLAHPADFAIRAEAIPTARAALVDLAPTDPVRGRLSLGQGRKWVTKPMRSLCAKEALGDYPTIADTMEAHNGAVAGWQASRSKAYARVAGLLAVEAFLWGRELGGTEWLLQDELLQRCLRLALADDAVRDALRVQYPHILLDEAQDIDATQMDLLLLLAGEGGLSVVGDPQQSIFGFRGADHSTFDRLQTRLLGGRQPEHSTQTWRSLPVIVDAVNAVFDGDEQHAPMQARRSANTGTVTALIPAPDALWAESASPPEQAPDSADFRIAQADALADQVVAFLGPDAPLVSESEVSRRPRPSDIAILVPSRTAVASLETALRKRDVRVTVRTSRDMARHPVAEGLAAAILALARTDDTRALLIALRSPVFACTDAEISRHVFDVGRLGVWHAGSGHGPVTSSLLVLQDAAHRFRDAGPGAAASFLIRRQGVVALLAADGADWVDGWSQVRLLVDSTADRHRAVAEPPHRFAEWLVDQLATAGRTNSSVLDEPDADSVTITTIHQAKGLQWPIVLTAALVTQEDTTSRLTLAESDVHTHLTRDYRYGPASTAQVPPELARLMYVAMTRARDHLVVSALGKFPRTPPPVVTPKHIADRLIGLGRGDVDVVPVDVRRGQTPGDDPLRLDREATAGRGPGDVRARLRAVASASAKVLRNARPSDAGHGEGAVGRPGPAIPGSASAKALQIGRSDAAATGDLVHSVLEQVDLAAFVNPEVHLDDILASRPDPVPVDPAARRLIDFARSSPVLARASAADIVRREIPVSGNHCDGDVVVVVQGVIDLLFAEGDGDGRRWVLVDYKTDSTGSGTIDFVARYAEQLAEYRRLLAGCGIEVGEQWLVRITPDGAGDIPVPVDI